eukprot:10175_3
MAREGVGLMDAVILAARSRVRGEIEDAGGVDGYEKKKKAVRAAVALDTAHMPSRSPRNLPVNHAANTKLAARERGVARVQPEPSKAFRSIALCS